LKITILVGEAMIEFSEVGENDIRAAAALIKSVSRSVQEVKVVQPTTITVGSIPEQKPTVMKNIELSEFYKHRTPHTIDGVVYKHTSHVIGAYAAKYLFKYAPNGEAVPRSEVVKYIGEQMGVYPIGHITSVLSQAKDRFKFTEQNGVVTIALKG
jgi:hypothetical protein